jgi:hypothetical protein
VPAFTGPEGLATVAVSDTLCALMLNVAVVLVAKIVVAALVTVSVCVVSMLVSNDAAPP